jgi:hypothetical protein
MGCNLNFIFYGVKISLLFMRCNKGIEIFYEVKNGILFFIFLIIFYGVK